MSWRYDGGGSSWSGWSASSWGGGSGGGGSRGAASTANTTWVSKKLTLLLRHGAVDAGINIDSCGWVKVDELLRHKDFKTVNLANIEEIVRSCAKQRFALKTEDGVPLIRATQGHSLREVGDSAHQNIRSIADVGQAEVVHGTYVGPWLQIREDGLKTMGRNHIHLCLGMPGSGVISGMRGTANVAIFVDIGKMLGEGVEVMKSSNGVILTAGLSGSGTLPPRFFSRAVWLGPPEAELWKEGADCTNAAAESSSGFAWAMQEAGCGQGSVTERRVQATAAASADRRAASAPPAMLTEGTCAKSAPLLPPDALADTALPGSCAKSAPLLPPSAIIDPVAPVRDVAADWQRALQMAQHNQQQDQQQQQQLLQQQQQLLQQQQQQLLMQQQQQQLEERRRLETQQQEEAARQQAFARQQQQIEQDKERQREIEQKEIERQERQREVAAKRDDDRRQEEKRLDGKRRERTKDEDSRRDNTRHSGKCEREVEKPRRHDDKEVEKKKNTDRRSSRLGDKENDRENRRTDHDRQRSRKRKRSKSCSRRRSRSRARSHSRSHSQRRSRSRSKSGRAKRRQENNKKEKEKRPRSHSTTTKAKPQDANGNHEKTPKRKEKCVRDREPLQFKDPPTKRKDRNIDRDEPQLAAPPGCWEVEPEPPKPAATPKDRKRRHVSKHEENASDVMEKEASKTSKKDIEEKVTKAKKQKPVVVDEEVELLPPMSKKRKTVVVDEEPELPPPISKSQKAETVEEWKRKHADARRDLAAKHGLGETKSTEPSRQRQQALPHDCANGSSAGKTSALASTTHTKKSKAVETTAESLEQENKRFEAARKALAAVRNKKVSSSGSSSSSSSSSVRSKPAPKLTERAAPPPTVDETRNGRQRVEMKPRAASPKGDRRQVGASLSSDHVRNKRRRSPQTLETKQPSKEQPARVVLLQRSSSPSPQQRQADARSRREARTSERPADRGRRR